MAGLQTTGTINSDTFSDFVDIERKEFSIIQAMVEPKAQQLYIKDNVAMHTGNTKQYKEVDTETFARLKREGEDSPVATVGVGYDKTMTFRRFAMEIVITKEMRDDNEDPQIMGQLLNLNHFAPQKMELDLTHRLTFASATSYTDQDGDTVDTSVGDGYALCYSAHDCAFSSTTYRNRVANDPIVSGGALELAQALTVTDIVNNYGTKRVMNFKTLITGPDPNTVHEVKRVLNSTTDPDQNNPGVINPYSGNMNHIVLDYLATTATSANDSTKKRYWFLAATGQGVKGWQSYFALKEPANLKTPDEDTHNDNWTLGVRVRYGICILTGRGIIGSLPTS